MKVYEILHEGLQRDRATKIINSFIKFVARELELEEMPTINLQPDNSYSVEYRSFGGYSPSDKSINLTIQNRHIQDVCRTLAHELVHYKQDLNGELNSHSGKDGSPQENEANAQAAVVMRKWGKLHPNLFKQSAVE
jgi:Zn-dependent peptidase ImmA (M78 family)